MTVQLDIPDSLLQKAQDMAARQKVSVDQFITTALAEQISAAGRPSIAERARRVDWDKVDKILARVPDVPPLPGDER
jgi:hypothetical protein